MAATKKTKKDQKRTLNSVFENSSLNVSKSYLSLAYGALTVVILFILIFLGIKAISQKKIGSITDEAVTTLKEEQALKKGESLYVVVEGDTLWSISEKFYKSGFKWTEIAKDNKILNPQTLVVGTKLMIKKDGTSQEEKKSEVSGSDGKITGTSYTVQRDDNLWEISVRAYGDGFKWAEIAKVNNLANPDVIHSGNTLKLPR